MAHIPSLRNPPNAPKKKKTVREPNAFRLQQVPSLLLPEEEENEEKCEWRWLRDSGNVREKFLRYNPEDVEQLNNIDSLQDMCMCYDPLLHSSQPQNLYEETYLKIMLTAAQNRLAVIL